MIDIVLASNNSGKLAEMREKGILSEEEFIMAKSKLLRI